MAEDAFAYHNHDKKNRKLQALVLIFQHLTTSWTHVLVLLRFYDDIVVKFFNIFSAVLLLLLFIS